MSLAQSTTPPPTPAAEAAGSVRMPRALRWIAGGTITATALSVLAFAVWPASAADKARDDGEQLGNAVSALYAADTTAEVEAAVADVQVAVSETRAHAGDAVADQVDDQAEALSYAAEGFVGTLTADDEFTADVYQAELNYAVDDLTRQAEDFRSEGPEVQQAFWDGYESTLSVD